MVSTENVAKFLTNNNIAELVGILHSKAVVPSNIMKGFKLTGFRGFQ